MNSKTLANGILRATGILIAIALLLNFLYLIQSVIIFLVVALILTLIGNPILDFFKRRLKFKHTMATVATLLIFVWIIIGFILLFVPLILAQGENLSVLNTAQIESNLIQLTNQVSVFLESHNIDASKIIKESNISSKLDFNLPSAKHYPHTG